MDSDFIVKTDHFEGPLDLLLSLIEKRKLFINDIALAEVADDYVQHVNDLPEYDLGNVADFLVLASTLLLIKSRSLLPGFDLSPEEEMQIEELEERLRLYKDVQNLSQELRSMFDRGRMYERGQIAFRKPVFSPGKEVTWEALHAELKDIFERQPKEEEKRPLVKVERIMSLEEMIDNLIKRMQQSLKMGFNEFSNKNEGKRVDVIISFLALLELVKLGVVRAHQENHFEDILMESDDVGTPYYG